MYFSEDFSGLSNPMFTGHLSVQLHIMNFEFWGRLHTALVRWHIYLAIPWTQIWSFLVTSVVGGNVKSKFSLIWSFYFDTSRVINIDVLNGGENVVVHTEHYFWLEVQNKSSKSLHKNFAKNIAFKWCSYCNTERKF